MEGVLEVFNQKDLDSYVLSTILQAQKIFISQLRKFVVSIYVMEIRFLVKYDLRKKMNAILGYYKLKL